MAINEISGLLVQNFIDPRQIEDVLTIMKDFIQTNDLKTIDREEGEKIKQTMNKILQAKDKNGHTPMYLASKTGSSAIVALLKRLQ